MRPKAKPLFVIALLMVTNYPLLGMVAAASLTGTVRDLGAADSTHDGISGVWIMVRGASAKVVGSGITNAQGAYKVEVSIPSKSLTAFYEKDGYKARPTIRTIMDFEKDQKPVFMVKEGATDEYYETVAKRINTAQIFLEGPAVVAGLSEAEKSRVIDHLNKAGAVNVIKRIRSEEFFQQLVSKVGSELESDKALGGRTIRVLYVPEMSGSLYLEGAVKSFDEKVKAEKIAKSVEGVKKVTNGLTVER